MGDEVQASDAANNDHNNDDKYHKYHVVYHDYHDGHHCATYLNDQCTDDDCGDEHYYLFTADDLAARDNLNYDAGYDRGLHYGAALNDPALQYQHGARDAINVLAASDPANQRRYDAAHATFNSLRAAVARDRLRELDRLGTGRGPGR